MTLKIINKHWNILQLNTELRETFHNKLIVALKRTKNLQEIIVDHMVKNGILFKKPFKKLKTKCCKQVIDTSTFHSYRT